MSNGDLSHSASTPQASAGARPRLAVIDGLRIAAALSVVLYHYVTCADKYWLGGSVQEFPRLRAITSYGWLGVDLFFLISGFVICMSSWDRGLGEFFVSRVTRLYPAYWFGVLLTASVLFLLPSGVGYPMNLGDVFANLTMLQTGVKVHDIDGSYWTLWIELLFYLLFALVVWRGVNYRNVVLFCCVWTAVSVILRASSSDLAQVIDPKYSMYFTAGIAIYLMYRFRPSPLLWGIVGISWLLALQSIYARMPGFIIYTHQGINAEVAAAIVTAFFVVLIGAGLGWFSRVQWRWLTVAGTLTYPLYLIHASIGFTLIYHLSNRLPKYVLLFGLVAGMLVSAWLIHQLVEKPVATGLKRWLNRGIAEVRENNAHLSRERIPTARLESRPMPPHAPVPVGAHSAD